MCSLSNTNTEITKEKKQLKLVNNDYGFEINQEDKTICIPSVY